MRQRIKLLLHWVSCEKPNQIFKGQFLGGMPASLSASSKLQLLQLLSHRPRVRSHVRRWSENRSFWPGLLWSKALPRYCIDFFLTFILLSAVDCKTEPRNDTSSCRANCGTSRTWELWEKIVTYGAHGGKQDCSERMIEEGNCNLDPCHSQPSVGPTSSPAGPTIAPGDQGL